MKVLACRGRDFGDKKLLYKVLSKIHSIKPITTIVSGCAKGASSLAIDFANDFNITVVKYPTNWQKNIVKTIKKLLVTFGMMKKK